MFPRFLLIVAAFTFLPVPFGPRRRAGFVQHAGDTLEHFPPRQTSGLRHFVGRGKGDCGTPQSSVLLITCESQTKARLVLAKYLSDLGLLPGSDAACAENRTGPSRPQVEKQGVVAAARCDRQVYIFTRLTGRRFGDCRREPSRGGQGGCDRGRDPVPIYVDRWTNTAFASIMALSPGAGQPES